MMDWLQPVLYISKKKNAQNWIHVIIGMCPIGTFFYHHEFVLDTEMHTDACIFNTDEVHEELLGIQKPPIKLTSTH